MSMSAVIVDHFKLHLSAQLMSYVTLLFSKMLWGPVANDNRFIPTIHQMGDSMFNIYLY